MRVVDEEKYIDWIDFLDEECDTLFYQGNGSSQTQVVHYTGGRKINATTTVLNSNR